MASLLMLKYTACTFCIAMPFVVMYTLYMANMIRAKVEICGKRPLLQHAFGPEAIPLEKAEKTGVAGNDPEEWRRTKMVTAEGQLFVRATYIFGMLRDAAKHTRKGKGSIQALLAATLQIEEERILLDRWMPQTGDPKMASGDPVYVDVSGVRNPSTKGRNVRYRLAASSGWKTIFHLLWDKTIVSRDQMRALASGTEEASVTDALRWCPLRLWMPKKRQPHEIWASVRERIWTRDGRRCVHCGLSVSLRDCHIDHIQSGKRGGNHSRNLRTLCEKCHVLRADSRHRGMIASALRRGIVPPNWRELVWED